MKCIDGEFSQDNEFAKRLKTAVLDAKNNRKWRAEYMALTMREMDKLEEGRIQGRLEGIEALIFDNLEEKKSKTVIAEKLVKQFSLIKEQAETYLEKYASKK